MTLTSKIFADSAPYNNQYQTNAKRILFVCSVGMLRSPTAQMVASAKGLNARACGSDVECALIPMSVNLINWADHIVFMTKGNLQQAQKEFKAIGYVEDINRKAIVWDIQDSFAWGDPVLCRTLEQKMETFL